MKKSLYGYKTLARMVVCLVNEIRIKTGEQEEMKDGEMEWKDFIECRIHEATKIEDCIKIINNNSQRLECSKLDDIDLSDETFIEYSAIVKALELLPLYRGTASRDALKKTLLNFSLFDTIEDRRDFVYMTGELVKEMFRSKKEGKRISLYRLISIYNAILNNNNEAILMSPDDEKNPLDKNGLVKVLEDVFGFNKVTLSVLNEQIGYYVLTFVHKDNTIMMYLYDIEDIGTFNTSFIVKPNTKVYNQNTKTTFTRCSARIDNIDWCISWYSDLDEYMTSKMESYIISR